MGVVFINGSTKKSTIPDFGYIKKKLDDNTWAVISECSKSGNAANYWDIGDCKSVHVKGRVGMIDIDDIYYVYIIGFNHNSDLDTDAMNTIDFGTFKDPASGMNICLVDNAQYKKPQSGNPYFSMYHFYGKHYGGWSGCDLRYDVLGSTNVPPEGYGSTKDGVNNVGNDPNDYDIVNNPVPNTLMAALPADLRTVMKQMSIWSDNVGDSNVADNVTKSIDYLPLMSEFEVVGIRNNANTTEQNYQKQYQYYVGNSREKHSHIDLSDSYYMTRSAYELFGIARFCIIDTNGKSYNDGVNAKTSQGLAPIFRV